MKPILVLAAVGLFIWLGVGGIAALARTTLNQGRVFGTPELASMSFVDPRTGWAVAADCTTQADKSASSACESEIYGTIDGGKSWVPTSRVLLTPRRLTFPDPKAGWLIGSIGLHCGANLCQNVIMLSEDGGKKWNRVSTVSAELTDVAAVSKNDVWAVGRACPANRDCSGVIVHTESGGQLWDNHELPIVSPELRTGRVSSLVGWVTRTDAVAGAQPLAMTRDGGASWTVVPTPCEGDGALADFTTPRDGWLVCSKGQASSAPFTVHRTANGGATWETVDSIPTPGPVNASSSRRVTATDVSGTLAAPTLLARSLQVSPTGNAWVALTTGQLVLVPTDATRTAAPSTDESLKEVRFLDNQHGWLLGSRSIWSTDDGGHTWVKSTVVAGPVA